MNILKNKPTARSPYHVEMSLVELRRVLKTWGYCLKKDGDELEIYPKGKRGALSYFTDDKNDARFTAAAEAAQTFTRSLEAVSEITTEETREALVEWFRYHRADWMDKLQSAWYSGGYVGFQGTNVEGTLQRLRNTNGRDVLLALTK